MAEIYLNGVLEEDVSTFYHICFFTDSGGLDLANEENYIFVPQVVCRIVDYRTIAVQDWYVKQKAMQRFICGRAKGPQTKPDANASSFGVEERLKELKRRQ